MGLRGEERVRQRELASIKNRDEAGRSEESGEANTEKLKQRPTGLCFVCNGKQSIFPGGGGLAT